MIEVIYEGQSYKSKVFKNNYEEDLKLIKTAVEGNADRIDFLDKRGNLLLFPKPVLKNSVIRILTQ